MSASKPQMLPSLKTFGFGVKAFRKYPELIPLVAVLGLACVGAAASSTYALYQKSDVHINKSAELPPWERVDPEKQQKLLNFNVEYKKIPELEALKREIGSYKC